jgi:hypothetical protein
MNLFRYIVGASTLLGMVGSAQAQNPTKPKNPLFISLGVPLKSSNYGDGLLYDSSKLSFYNVGYDFYRSIGQQNPFVLAVTLDRIDGQRKVTTGSGPLQYIPGSSTIASVSIRTYLNQRKFVGNRQLFSTYVSVALGVETGSNFLSSESIDGKKHNVIPKYSIGAEYDHYGIGLAFWGNSYLPKSVLYLSLRY